MSIQSINARNQFRGKIKEIILGPVVSEVDVDTPAGIVTSVITTRSVKELDLQVGTEVLVSSGAPRCRSPSFDAGPQPCSGFMRGAASRGGAQRAGRRLLRLSNSRRGLFPNPALAFILPLCQNVGHRDRSQIPLPDLEIESHAFCPLRPVRRRMALSAAAASAPIFVLNSLDANVSIVDPLQACARPTGKEPHHLYLTPDESRSWWPTPPATRSR